MQQWPEIFREYLLVCGVIVRLKLAKNCKICSFPMEFCGIRRKTIIEQLMRMKPNPSGTTFCCASRDLLLLALSILQQKKEEFFVVKFLFCLIVRLIGLEPTRLSTPDPKSGASTNFATGAGGH